MPNAAAQLMVDPLFWCGILCFKEMYSGVSSVPRISSGSRSMLKKNKNG
jgi:hypothetical protein